MNVKITFSQLCAVIAKKTAIPRKDTEDFLREFFSSVAECLEAGETVKLKGIGTFKVQKVGERKSVNVTTGEEMIIPGHSKVAFVASKEIAAAVNIAFQAFEPVEVADDISDEEMQAPEQALLSTPDSSDTTVDGESNINIQPETSMQSPAAPDLDIEKISATPINAETVESNDEPDEIEIEKITPQPVTITQKPTPATESVEPLPTASITEEENTSNDDSSHPVFPTVDETEQDDEIESTTTSPYISHHPAKKWGGFIIGLTSGIAVAACIFIALLLCNPSLYNALKGTNANPTREAAATMATATPAESTKKENAEAVITADESIKETVPTQPSDEETIEKEASVVYDTISKTRFLTTMAKDHYGNYHLWPYIYIENQHKLGHPDRIRPGTPVVVPPLEKYNVDPKDPQEIAKAKKMGIDIYARYNGKKAKG